MARGILVTLLLVSCLYITYGLTPDIRHDLVVGHKAPNDVVLFEKTVIKLNKNPLREVFEFVTYPEYIPAKSPVISEIDAVDYNGYDRGGFAYIVEGGVGGNNVTLKINSQKGYGYKFIITIYGYY